jgi:hypothetical protein
MDPINKMGLNLIYARLQDWPPKASCPMPTNLRTLLLLLLLLF